MPEDSVNQIGPHEGESSEREIIACESLSKKQEEEALIVDWPWMLFYCLIMGMSCLHTGWAVFGNTQVAPVLT